MSLKLYGNLLSQPARAVAVFLSANKVPFETKLIDIMKGDNKKPEFLKLNPFHKIPVIDDNGFVVRESVAILRYLCHEKNVPDHWYPKDSKEQARVDEYLEWHHLDTRFNCMNFFAVKYLAPMFTGKPPNSKEVSQAEEKMKTTLGLIENIWLKNKPYLINNAVTIADLLAVCEVEQLRMGDYDARTEYPNIAAWMERVRQDLNPHYDDANKLLNKVVAKRKA